MATFNVSWEMQVDAETPEEAAKLAEEMLRDTENSWQYYVQDDETKKIVSVDLEECDEDMVVDASDYRPIIQN